MVEKFKRFSLKKQKLIIFCCMILLGFLIVGAIFAIHNYSRYNIKTNGIELKATKDFAAHNVQYYLQNEPEWSNDLIGDSGRSMGGTGCLISCVASAMTDLGTPITPKELNAKLTTNNAFDGANLIWYKINEIFPEIDYEYARVFSSATIEEDLKLGLLPIVNVKFYGNGVTHWVLVIGAEDGEFLIYDPANPHKKPMPLSTHGKVYSYRVLVGV